MTIPVLIIPVLNRFDLLENTLDSIDYPIDEVLVINNSGDDNNTLNIRNNRYENFVLKVLDLPSNMGISGSWNLGIKLYPHKPWWLIGSADTAFLPGSLQKFDEYSSSERMIFSEKHYSAFSLGEDIVKTVGLFDEFIYPAYYEDNDYTDRVKAAGREASMVSAYIPVNDNGGSQTIKSDEKLAEQNHVTFVANGEYYNNKPKSGSCSCCNWNLERRRKNEWVL